MNTSCTTCTHKHSWKAENNPCAVCIGLNKHEHIPDVKRFHLGVVAQRWYEAMAEPTYDKWHSLAGMLALIADSAETHAPNSPMARLLKRMYDDAYGMAMDLQRSEVAA